MSGYIHKKAGWTILVGGVVFSLLLTACNGAAKKTFTVGMIAEVSIHAPAIDGFKAGMADLGYVEGENITYIYNGVMAASTPEVIDAEIKAMLESKVDMLFVTGNVAAVRVKLAVDGTDTPVVFGAITNPVGEGLVNSITLPGGNLTGVQVGPEIPKALELLVTITPNVQKIYVPYNPSDEVSAAILGGLNEVASQLKIEFVRGEVGSAEEAAAAIESLPADVQAIFRVPSPTLDPQNSALSQAAISRGLPLASGHPLDEAVLLTLASNMPDVGKQAARLAHQIRQGVKPADLPVETAEFYLTINLKTAQAINIDLPNEIVSQATTIIR